MLVVSNYCRYILFYFINTYWRNLMTWEYIQHELTNLTSIPTNKLKEIVGMPAILKYHDNDTYGSNPIYGDNQNRKYVTHWHL